MNTDQRKLVRNGCYFFAVVAVLAGAGALLDGGAGPLAVGVLGAVVLVIAGKFIWAGRPAS